MALGFFHYAEQGCTNMISPFQLHRPSTIKEASALLTEHAGDIRILAGGSELILLLKMGLVRVGHVVDIKSIGEMSILEFDQASDSLRIGGLVTHRELENSDLVRRHFPLIVDMERQVANVRVRNVGTLGGNLCFAEPHADPGTLLLAYDAKLKAWSHRGQRSLNIADFFLDYYETALQADEVLTEIVVPKMKGDVSGTYLRFCPGERPIIAVALLMAWAGGGCSDARLAVGCVGPKPFRAAEIEADLRGKAADEIASRALTLGERTALMCDPLPDIWGSTEYKRQIVKTLVSRGLEKLCGGGKARG